MTMWRCPHCGTPQAETARCWVCRRSSTACGTCRNFRRAIAGGLGYCALDRRRDPLVGDEIRPCWEAAEPVSARHDDGAPPWMPAGFVDMDDALPPGTGPGTGEARWSLWGDPDA
jgi:hypothetical protein